MQRDSIQEKANRYYPKNPCKPLEDCNYDQEDYDPCESNEDITEKDLAVLLREETAKLQGKDLTKANEGPEIQKESRSKGGKEQEVEGKSSGWEDPQKSKKKKICKNFIKNPFFTNPFKFSSDLPPPPASPPPQFLPEAETESSERICTKAKKKKPCKKAGKFWDGSEPYGEEDGRAEDEDKADVNKADSDKAEDNDGNAEDDKGVEGDVEDETDEGEPFDKDKKEDKKRRCRKKSFRAPCKKKVSDVSISLLPPQIPPLQRELPLQSPKNIPEVERQLGMACGKPEHKCKKRDKAKTKQTS